MQNIPQATKTHEIFIRECLDVAVIFRKQWYKTVVL